MEQQNNNPTQAKEELSVCKLIEKKRDGKQLSAEEIKYFIKSVVNGEAENSQIGAMLMAIYLRGLDPRSETVELTEAMRISGDTLSWPLEWKGSLGDKHSTGGVGDKVSIILGPALAACGVKVPMLSGRGLEHTGGTIDKLESIPGLKVTLSSEEMRAALEDPGCGCFIGVQTSNICPADKKMYATRDITATVRSVPLITSSIVSKKAAEGIDALVLDVKFGRAAFLSQFEDAKELAQSMLTVAKGYGLKTSVLLTDMSKPIGRCVGNSLEILECIADLVKPSSMAQDTRQLTFALGGSLLYSLGRVASLEEGTQEIEAAFTSGKALACFQRMLEHQGVTRKVVDTLTAFSEFPSYALEKDNENKVSKAEENLSYVTIQTEGKGLPLDRTESITLLMAPSKGYVKDLDAMAVGRVSFEMGAGRKRSDSVLDLAVGVRILRKYGELVQQGEPWLELHHRNLQEEKLHFYLKTLQDALTLSPTEPEAENIIRERLF